MSVEQFRNRIFNTSATLSWPLPDESISVIITSPPYWQQRDNGIETLTEFNGKRIQIGQEKTPQEYVDNLTKIFDNEGKRVLKPYGQLWVNLGDTFSKGIKNFVVSEPKQQLMIPSRFAIMMQEHGWVLRNTLIWAKGVTFEDDTSKGGGMPSAVHDRLNLNHEMFFGFVKEKNLRKPYYFDETKFTISDIASKSKSKLDYFSNMDSIRIKPVWVNEDGERIDFYGRVAGSRPNAGASPKQHSVSQPNLQIFNHPFGKNPGSVWLVNSDSFEGQKLVHTSPYPKSMIKKLIKFSSPELICKVCRLPISKVFNRKTNSLETLRCECNDGVERSIVLDPFMGSGTTALAAIETGRDFCGLELNLEYIKEADRRINVKSKVLSKKLIEFQH